MRKIIIDTNTWLAPFESKVDLFGQIARMSEDEPYVIVVTTSVLDELEAMSKSKVRRKNVLTARGALAAIGRLKETGKLIVEKTDGPADGTMITLALQIGNPWVITNDRALRMRLGEKKITVLLLKDGHKLDFAQGVRSK